MKNIILEDDLLMDYNFLMICNNFIVSILKKADIKQWSSERLDIKSKDQKKFDSKQYDIFYWQAHGYATTINKSLYKHIIFSLISDYNIYVSDAIECARKGHFSTAFTLLRKPFKDDLFLIELFYTSGYRQVSKFIKSKIDNYTIEGFTKEQKMKVMRKVCKKINFFTAKHLWDLIYNPKSKEGLEKIWNKTMHIITTRPAYKTEDGNLNMVFSNTDVVDEHIIYFYKVVSSVQLYFITLILHILRDEKLITIAEYEDYLVTLFFAFSCTISCDQKLSDEQIAGLVLHCPKCSNPIKVTRDDLVRNHINQEFCYICNKCNMKHNINIRC